MLHVPFSIGTQRQFINLTDAFRLNDSKVTQKDWVRTLAFWGRRSNVTA
jgi:hypothetical protein